MAENVVGSTSANALIRVPRLRIHDFFVYLGVYASSQHMSRHRSQSQRAFKARVRSGFNSLIYTYIYFDACILTHISKFCTKIHTYILRIFVYTYIHVCGVCVCACVCV